MWKNFDISLLAAFLQGQMQQSHRRKSYRILPSLVRRQGARMREELQGKFPKEIANMHNKLDI